MNLKVKIVDEVLQKFPDLRVLVCQVKGVRVFEADPELEEVKEEVFAEVRSRFTLEGLKDEHVFRAYRDFFWRIGVDPTKTRPAAEALIRRVLGGGSIPRINTAVDAYNLASIATCLALAAFDTDRLNGGRGDIIMRFADKGEEFLGIGMDKPVTLAGGEIVMADASRLIAIYPHRDADYSRITLQTKNLVLVSCGVPGISVDQLREAADTASEFVVSFCGGTVGRVQ
jgi:DNA/RNA-binding domain of Phe-tRNA-synthetase-like protein